MRSAYGCMPRCESGDVKLKRGIWNGSISTGWFAKNILTLAEMCNEIFYIEIFFKMTFLYISRLCFEIFHQIYLAK